MSNEEARKIIQEHVDKHTAKSMEIYHRIQISGDVDFNLIIEQYKEAAIAAVLSDIVGVLGLQDVMTSE